MANGQDIDSRVLSTAAVQAAHFERWRRLHSPTQFFVPKGLEGFLPESPRSIPRLLQDASAANHDAARRDLTERAVRSAAVTLARAKSKEVAGRVLQHQNVDPHLPDGTGRPRKGVVDALNRLPLGWVELRDDLDDATPVCRCAEVFSRCKGARNPNVVCHHSTLSFDSDTFISEATEHVILRAERHEAEELITGGRPPNWARNGGGDLFDDTFVCDDRGQRLHIADAQHSGLPEQFFLREVTSWQTNRDSAALSDIVLSIEDYSEVAPSGQLRLRFNYRLRECIQTQFFIARSSGGINLDEGESDVLWVPDPEGKREGLLHIFASKRLRFAQTREIGREEALLLNMMGPAILSMLLQRLAFDNPLEVVSRNPAGPAFASQPPADSSPSQPPPSVTRAKCDPQLGGPDARRRTQRSMSK